MTREQDAAAAARTTTGSAVGQPAAGAVGQPSASAVGQPSAYAGVEPAASADGRSAVGPRAVVLGGSIAGLLAAAVLAQRSVDVTVVDRDELVVSGPEALAPRRGVPQGEQTHHLLALGAARLEEILPGLRDDLIAEGCTPHDDLVDAALWQGGSWRARTASGLDPVTFTRPVLEGVIRRRVLALPGIRAVRGAASGLILSEDGSTVIGAEVRGAADLPDGRVLGDLVVDATGRSTRTPQWLEGLGFPRPTTSTAWVHMGYTCYRVRLADGALPDGVSTLLGPPSATNPISVHLRDVGRGEHMVIAYGVGKNYPPTDVEAILEIAEQLPTPLIARALRGAEQLSAPASSRAASDHRLLWEDSLDQPEGLIHLGDAAAAYNPSSGQGMTMAAVAATVLRDLLATELLDAGDRGAGGGDRGAGVGGLGGSSRGAGGAGGVAAGDVAADGVAATGVPAVEQAAGEVLRSAGFARRFQRALSPHLDAAWQSVVRKDARVPGAQLDNVEIPEPLSPERLAAAIALEAADPAFALESAQATHWIRPDWIRQDHVLARLDAWIADAREVPAHLTDPRDVPEVTEAVLAR
ncbi:hypothetical protein ACXET9_08905 [Brachybacterium sp. DNPG3]